MKTSMMTLANKFQSRPASLADVPAIVDLRNASSRSTRETDVTAVFIQNSIFDSAYFNSPGLCFVAWDGDEVAGLCLCNATTFEYPEAGYLGSLSVRRRWQKLGLGRALTLHALRAFYDRGTSHVLTETDGDGFTKAFRVYEKTGMAIFRREFVFEKAIRPGRDLLKRYDEDLEFTYCGDDAFWRD